MVSAPLGVPVQPEIFLSVARFWLAMDVVIGDVFINTVLNSNNNKTQRILIILFGFRRFNFNLKVRSGPETPFFFLLLFGDGVNFQESVGVVGCVEK